MTDRVYPSAKPNATANNGTTTGTTNAPPLPAAKSHLYNPNRHPYRLHPNHHHHHRSRRSCLCLCCFWSILLLIALVLLAAIAGCVAYYIYTPRRPTFSVTALRISEFNLSTTPADDTTHLTSSLNVTVAAKNPNKKLVYVYDPIAITTVSSEVVIANGSFPAFTSSPDQPTVIRSSLSTNSEFVDADKVTSLRSDLKKKNGLPLSIVMDTKVVVNIGKLKSKKLGIRVTCDGIRGIVPKSKSPSVASISDAKCKVDLRIKIWRWTF